MANTGLFIGFIVIMCALGADSADPVVCMTQLHKDLLWYDAVVKNITYQGYMGNEGKLAAMCRALHLVVNRAVQLGCPLSHISELQNRQRNLFAAGATACLAARPQAPTRQPHSGIAHPSAAFTPDAATSPLGYPAMANKNRYAILDPCDLRIRNCYLQFQVNLLMRFRIRNHTCEIIESFANCLLAPSHCGFSQFLKPFIIKQAVAGTQFAFWEAKECPRVRYMPNTASIIRDTTITRLPVTPSGSVNTNPYSKQTFTDCGKATFRCVNGNCVRLDNVCNGLDNCGDASDEIGCQNKDRRNALEIEKIFIKYNCYDSMSICTSVHVRPLLLLLQAGQLSSLDSLCKASNKVFHCAVHESCPLSSEDRDKLSALLKQSFEQLVSRKTCELIAINNTNTSGSHNINDDTTTSSTPETVYTSTTPGVINLNTLSTHLVTDFPSTTSTAESTNLTSTTESTNLTSTTESTNLTSTTEGTNLTSTTESTNLTSTTESTNLTSTTESTSLTSTADIIDFNNITRVPDITVFTNATSNPGIIDLTTTSNPDIIDFNTTSNPDIIDFNTTSISDIIDFTNTPDITDFNNTTSNPGNINFTNTTSNPGITDFTKTTSNLGINDVNTTRNPDITDFTNTTSNLDITPFTKTSNTVITTNTPNFSNTTYSTASPNDTQIQNLGNSNTVTSPCVKSCDGLQSGNYQSCAGCNMFATCSEGVLYDNRPCPAALLWDDASKSCDESSSTCQAPQTCVSSCDGLQSGDYQSCQGCDVYLTCNNGVMQDNRACQAGLLWNDINKRCEQFSTTCVPSGGKTTTNKCIKSCNGLAPGNYQSCLGCNVYASCDNGVLTDNRPCPNFMRWDDTVKRCENVSKTCE